MMNINDEIFGADVTSDLVSDGFILTFILGLLVFSFLMYIFTAYSTMKVAKRCGYDKPWLAWIPIANQFVLIILVKDYVHNQLRDSIVIIFGISLVISIFFGIFGFVTFAISLYAFFIVAKWFSEKYVAHFVIAIITLGISVPFSLFRFRNRTPNKVAV